MYSNKSQILVRQGEIVGLQVPSSDAWTYFAYGSAGNLEGRWDNIAELNQAQVLTLDKGMYEFARPSDLRDFDLREITNDKAGQTYVPGHYGNPYDLQDACDFLILYAVCSAASGTEGYITGFFHNEYTTDDVWRNVEMPPMNPTLYTDALQLVARMPNIMENPLHFSTITKWVKKLAPAVGRLGTKVTGNPLMEAIGQIIGGL